MGINSGNFKINTNFSKFGNHSIPGSVIPLNVGTPSFNKTKETMKTASSTEIIDCDVDTIDDTKDIGVAEKIKGYFSAIYQKITNKEEYKIEQLDCSDEIKEELKKQNEIIENLNKQIDDIEGQIKSQQHIIDSAQQATLSVNDPNYNIAGTSFSLADVTTATNNLNELNQQLAALKQTKMTVCSYYYQNYHLAELQPYDNLLDSEVFKNYTLNEQTETEVKDLVGNDFDYLTEEQYKIINYLYQTSGKNEAKDYYKLLESDLNNLKGMEEAYDMLQKLTLNIDEEYLNEASKEYGIDKEYLKGLTFIDLMDTQKLLTQIKEKYTNLTDEQLTNFIQTMQEKASIDDLSLETVANYLGVSVKGLGDGIDTFFSGLVNCFNDGRVMSQNEYAAQYILAALSMVDTHLDDAYQISTSIGNMMVPSVVAVVATMATNGLGAGASAEMLGGIASKVLFFSSTFGNAKHEKLVSGSDKKTALQSAFLNATSEVCLEYVLGTIPGLGRESNSIIKNLFGEGFEEFIQEYYSSGVDAYLYGTEINLDELNENARKSFIYGCLTSYIMNGAQKSINFTINGVSKTINASQIQEAIKEDGSIDIEKLNSMMQEKSDNVSNFNQSNDVNSNSELHSIEKTNTTEKLSPIEKTNTTEKLSPIEKENTTAELSFEYNPVWIEEKLKEYDFSKFDTSINGVIFSQYENAIKNMENNPELADRLLTQLDYIKNNNYNLKNAIPFSEVFDYFSPSVKQQLGDKLFNQISAVYSFIKPDNKDFFAYSMLAGLANNNTNDSSLLYEINREVFSPSRDKIYSLDRFSKYFTSEENNTIKNYKLNSINSTLGKSYKNDTLKSVLLNGVVKIANNSSVDQNVLNEIYELSKKDVKDISINELLNYKDLLSQEDLKLYYNIMPQALVSPANSLVAMQYNDPKQYIVSKFSDIAKRNPNNYALIDEMYKIRCMKPSSIGFDQLSPFYDFLSQSEQKELKMIMDNHIEHYTQNEQDMINAYTYIVGPAITAYLRGTTTEFLGHPMYGDFDSASDYVLRGIKATGLENQLSSIKNVDDAVAIMDNIIEKSPPIKEKTTVYRSCNGLFFDGKEIDVNELKKGQKFNDKAFVSTSVNPTHASTSDSILLEIEVPEGTKAAYLEAYSGVKSYNQQELLLDRGLTFEIVEDYQLDPKTGQIKLKVRVVEDTKTTTVNNFNTATTFMDKIKNLFKGNKNVYSDLDKANVVHTENIPKNSLVNQLNNLNLDQSNHASNYYDKYVKGNVNFDSQQIDLKDVLSYMKQNGLMDRFTNEMNDLYSQDVYKNDMPEHGIDHVERVLFNAMYLGQQYNLNASDMNILIEAAKYHDSGRRTLNAGDGHGHTSAVKLREILANSNYSESEINKMCAAIEYHEENDNLNSLQDICEQYNISQSDYQSVKQIADILKDSDAVDRVRFPGNLDANYLRTDMSKKIIKAAYQIQEIRGTNDLNEKIKNGTYSENIVNEINQMRNAGVPDYLLSFYYNNSKIFNAGLINGVKKVILSIYKGGQ